MASRSPSCRATRSRRPTLVDARARGGGQACRERAAAAQPLRRRGGLPPTRTASCARRKGFKEAYAKFREGGWTGLAGRPRIRRPGPAETGQRRARGDDLLAPTSRSACIPASATAPTTRSRAHADRELQADLPAEARRRHLVGHHVPDRAAMRHRPRPDPHQGRAGGRRQLPHHRHQDLHLAPASTT